MTWPTSRPGYWDCDCGRECANKPLTYGCRAEWRETPTASFPNPLTMKPAPTMRRLYTQADLDAAVQAAARVGDIAVNQNAEMRDQLREIDEAVVALSKIVIGEGVLPAGNYPGAAPMLNHLHDTIRARGPTPALDAALAQARREVWEKAREVARNVHPSAASATGEAHMRSYRDAIVHAISAAAGEEGK